ncbi:MAG: PqqD family peptide modification chaperone [Endomicrobiales bacterium]|nr:PqqD family peptide modification chaperone [Endomicrobiales bacterium]
MYPIPIYPSVSVIVPVFNEEDIISSCITALLSLDYPKDRLELIFVDNNSNDKSASIIKQYPVRYIFEKRRGRSAARNSGIKAATGEILAFTDADCVVEEKWLKNLVVGFKNGNVGCCGGRTVSYNPANFIEKYFDWFFETQPQKLASFTENYFIGPIFATCNLACRKSVLEEVGYFDDNMVAGEDTDLVWRINFKGYQINYVKDALARHKRRGSIGDFPELYFDYVYWQYYLILKYEKIVGLSYDFSRIARNILSSAAESALSLFKGRGKRIESLFHLLYVFSSILSLCSLIYAWFDIKVLGKKVFSPLGFNPKTVIWRWDGSGEALIMNLESKNGYRLNEIAARVWELSSGSTRPDEIADIISEEYDVEKEEMIRDVSCIIDDLKTEGLMARTSV